MNPDPQQGGLLGFFQRMRKPNEQTGLTPFQQFGAALDPLIMPEMRAGQQIREQGAQRVAQANRNKTKEFLASQPNGAIYAQALDMGVPIGEVYRAFLAEQRGDFVVVGNSLVNRKTGEVVFSAPTSKGGTITRFNPDTNQMEIIQSDDLSSLSSSNQTQAQKVLMASKSLMGGFNEYERLFDEGGAAVLPGAQRDALQLARRNLQMQMKELFNLGVLNGPDLDLMNEMIVDTTDAVNYALDITGVADLNLRVKENLKNLKIQLENLASPQILALGVNPRDIFGSDTRSTNTSPEQSQSEVSEDF
tara:strand:- start:6119 stop:7033 length:915 start_codon:yes stop_codon:yes gene_type:complete